MPKRVLIAYPGATHSTFDVARGYESALRELGWHVAAFQYHNYIRFYTENIQHWNALGLSDYTASIEDALVLASERLAIHAVDVVPDVVLIIAGSTLHRRAYDLLHRLNIPLVLLCTESPYEDDHQAKIAARGHIAAVLTNDQYSVETLRAASGVPTHYLPHSYDPARHYPGVGEVGYGSSVFFHGTLWPERDALLAPLRTIAGARITGYTLEEARYTPHTIDNAELARYYRAAQICVNQHRRMKTTAGDEIPPASAYSLGPRAFELAACGAFQLSDYRPELAAVFGESVPVYSDGAELFELVNYFLARPERRAALREQQHAAVRDCTFTQRARAIVAPLLEEVGHGR